MSNTIDNKVVQMTFDNRQFESGVKTSLSTLDTLKKSLNLDGVTKGLNGVNDAASKLDMNPFSTGLQSVNTKLSALNVFAVNTFCKIADSAVNAGVRMVKALSIDNISEGYADYNRKLTSVQTITNATGKSIEEVSGYFNQLDEYADKTIYNLDDMTGAFAKFTNAGVDLDKSVPAIKGISNMVALAGQDANAASIAYYNLSQSIAGGFLTTMDYKSLNLANVATKEWKQQMIDAAIAAGTLTKTSDGLYKIPGVEKACSDAALFNEQLSTGWATTDVLLDVLGKYGDETTEIGSKAQAAAQDVKSFGMMMETLKASVGTGWTDTFEILVGNLEESKALFTPLTNTIGGFLDSMADARNNLLQGWKDLGGRTMAIDAIKNAFEGLMSVIKPIKEAFREVFPRITSEQLFNATKAIKEFTEKMKLSGEQSKKLKEIFIALFSFIKSTFSTAASVAKVLFTVLKPLLSIIGSIAGKMISFFTGTLSKGKNIADSVSGSMKELRTQMSEKVNTSGFEKLGSVLGFVKDKISGLIDFALKVKDKIFSTIGSAFNIDNVTDVASSVANALNWLINVLAKLGSAVKSTLGPMIKSVADYVSQLSIVDTFANVLKSGGIAAMITLIGGSIKSLFFNKAAKEGSGTFLDTLKQIKNFFTNLSTVPKAITKVFGDLGDVLKTWQKSIKVEMIKSIAISIAILAASLFVLSGIDSKALGVALGAISSMIIELAGAMILMMKMSSNGKGLKGALSGFLNAKSFETASRGLIAFASAVLILGIALKMMASLSWDQLAKGLLAITALIGELVVTSLVLSNYSGEMTKGAKGLISMSLAVLILSNVVDKLGNMSWDQLGKGLLAVTSLLGELVVTSLLLSNYSGEMKASAIGLILISTAIVILSNVVEKLGNMSWDQLGKGLLVVTGLLGELVVTSLLLSNYSGEMKASAIGLILISTAVAVLAKVVESLANLSWDQLGKGLLAVTGLLVELMIAAVVLDECVGGRKLIAIGIGLIAVSTALKILSGAVIAMGGMSVGEVVTGLVALGGALAILAVALTFMSGTLAGAAALVVAAAGIAILTPALIALGNMDITSVCKGLLVLAGALAIMGVAGMLIMPAVPGLIGLGIAMGLIGIATLAAGVGLTAFAAALVVLSSVGKDSVVAMTEAFVAFCDTISQNSEKITAGITAIMDIIINVLLASISRIGEVITSLILTILDIIINCAPQLIETIWTLIDTFLNTVAEHLPSIIQAGYDCILAFLEGLRNNIGEIVTTAADIVVEFLNALGEKLPDIVNAGVDLVINFINGIADGVVENAEQLRAAMDNLCESMLEAVLTFFGIHSPSTVFADIGKNLILGLIDGIGGFASSAVDTVKELAGNLVNSIGDKASKFLSKGKELMTNLKDGISNKLSAFKDKAKEVVSNAVTAVGSKAKEFLSKGKELITNVKDGIANKASEVKNKAKSVITDAVDGIKGKLSDFKSAGKDLIAGLSKGIKDKANDVINAAKGVVSDAIEGAKNLLGINSPSKVFAEIGRYSDEGLIVGLNKYASKVVDASKNVGKKAVNGLSNSISTISDLINGGIDANPTIRPVIDLSNVANGAKAINGMLDMSPSVGVMANLRSISSSMSNGQNGGNDDVISAINNLSKKISGMSGNTYTINGITYDDGSNVSNAVETLIRATRIERRV